MRLFAEVKDAVETFNAGLVAAESQRRDHSDPKAWVRGALPSVEQNASDAARIAERFDALLRAMREYLDT
jgi:hypothetical protein